MIRDFASTVGLVITFRLVSGEEMIAKVEDISNDKRLLVITEPAFIAHTQRGLQFAPGMFTIPSKQQVTLNTQNVSIFAETDEAIKLKYIEAITGIQLPDKQIIMG